jgi:FkbM family methyltransferase
MTLATSAKQLGLRIYGAWLGHRGTTTIGGVRLAVPNGGGSATLGTIVRELNKDEYGLDEIRFQPGDVVIDIGAHVGLFSCYVAKRYPFLRVVAVEPVPPNFASLQANLRANGLSNVTALNLAVTGDGRDVDIMVDLRRNSGGGSAQQRRVRVPTHSYFTVASTTLDALLEEHAGGRCKLLKIDCEGSEHEVLHASRRLDQVEYVRGEFHINQRLRQQGHSIERLVEHVQRHVGPDRVRYVGCAMAE